MHACMHFFGKILDIYIYGQFGKCVRFRTSPIYFAHVAIIYIYTLLRTCQDSNNFRILCISSI